jgi:hypothetical protein
MDQEKAWKQKYEKMPYKDIAARMLELRDQIAEAENTASALKAELDVIRIKVVPVRYANDGVTSQNFAGIGRLGLTKDAYCTQKPDKKDELFVWLRDNNFGDLIKDTVNPSSLKSLVKELAEDDQSREVEFTPGEDADEAEKTKFDQINELVNYTPFMRAAVTKK